MILLSVRHATIKSLRGYRRGHRVPDSYGEAADQFVATAAEDEMREHVELVFRTARDLMGYSRRQLSVEGPANGAASLATPDFSYHLSVTQSEDDPTMATWRREVVDVRSPEIVVSDAFDAVFRDAFDTLEVRASSEVDVGEIIDRVEDRKPQGIAIGDYPSDASWCDFRMTGLDGTVRISTEGISLRFRTAVLPSRLLKSFLKVSRSLGINDTLGPFGLR